ncbi:MAG: CBS domain-containing protein [Promethearchaeota archaeon]
MDVLEDLLTFASTGDLHSIHPDDPIYQAMQDMALYQIRHMLVVDDEGKLKGVFSGRDILRVLNCDEKYKALCSECQHNPDEALAQPVSRIALANPITLSRNHTVYDAIKRMVAPYMQLEATVGSLPIVQGEKLVGIITERDILPIFHLIEQKVGRKAEWIPNTNPVTSSPATTIREAINVLVTNEIRHLPLIGPGDKLEGIVTMTDLINANFLLNKPYSEVMDEPLSSIMVKNVYHLNKGDSLEKAVNIMTKRNIGSLLYMDGGKLHAIVTERDVLKLAYELIADS